MSRTRAWASQKDFLWGGFLLGWGKFKPVADMGEGEGGCSNGLSASSSDMIC